MGWKNVKEHYRIEHIVQINENQLQIGSSYIQDLIVVDMEGTVVKRYERGLASNENLERYQQEIDANPALFKELMTKPDTFEKSITVYTWEGEKIIEKQCESTEWPSVTHDGELMSENTFSVDKEQVIRWAKKSAKSKIHHYQEAMDDYAQKMAKMREVVIAQQANLDRLELDYPDIQVTYNEDN
jgi:hypothetical protein